MVRKIVVAVFLLALLSSPLFAELSSDTLNKNITLTQRGLLMSQVDIVSLYLSSSEVFYAPRLNKNKIEIEFTILNPSIARNKEGLTKFFNRHLTVFVDVLSERLRLYLPKLASEFNYKTDLVFVINEGSERHHLARWQSDAIVWEKGGRTENLPVQKIEDVKKDEIIRTGKRRFCDCPSLVK